MTKTTYTHASKALLSLAGETRHSVSKLNTLTIVRHGQTDWNKVGKFNSCTNLELSSEGISLCHSLAQRYQGLLDTQTTIVSSPLTRCIQTAEALFPGVDLSTDPNIREMDFGGFEGLSPKELRENGHSKELEAWRSSEVDDPVLEVETVHNVLERAKCFFDTNNFADQSVLLVTHGVFSRILISASMGLNPLLYRSLRLDNCKCAQVQNEDDQPRLILLNSLPSSGIGE